MPGLLKALTVIGTAAMLWVGGSIVIHGFEELGFATLGHWIENVALATAHLVPETLAGAVEWGVKATLDGIFGLLLGLALIPVGEKLVTPVWRAVFSPQ